MNRTLVLLVAALFLATVLPNPALAGAWTLAEGTGYNKVAVNLFQADETFGQAAEGFEEFTDFTVNYYAEYGITDKITFIGQIPLRRSTNEALGDEVTTNGIGDVDLGIRWNHLNKNWVISTQYLYKAPFLYDEDEELPLGNGQSDVELRVQVGRSLHPYGYIGIEAGYRFRAEEPSDEFRYLVEYGFDVSKKVYLRTKLDVIEAIDSTEVIVATDGNPNFPVAFDLGRVEASIGYKFNERSSVEFTFTESIFGDNILDGQTFQFGYVFALKPQEGGLSRAERRQYRRERNRRF